MRRSSEDGGETVAVSDSEEAERPPEVAIPDFRSGGSDTEWSAAPTNAPDSPPQDDDDNEPPQQHEAASERRAALPAVVELSRMETDATQASSSVEAEAVSAPDACTYCGKKLSSHPPGRVMHMRFCKSRHGPKGGGCAGRTASNVSEASTSAQSEAYGAASSELHEAECGGSSPTDGDSDLVLQIAESVFGSGRTAQAAIAQQQNQQCGPALRRTATGSSTASSSILSPFHSLSKPQHGRGRCQLNPNCVRGYKHQHKGGPCKIRRPGDVGGSLSPPPSAAAAAAVSYTHLTLPTILLV